MLLRQGYGEDNYDDCDGDIMVWYYDYGDGGEDYGDGDQGNQNRLNLININLENH